MKNEPESTYVDFYGTDMGTCGAICRNCQYNLTEYISKISTEVEAECPKCKLKIEWGDIHN